MKSSKRSATLGSCGDAFESGDIRYLTRVLNIITRAHGMTASAKEADITTVGLYKALGKNGDPRLSTLLGVIEALGFKLSAKADARVRQYREEMRLSELDDE